MTRVMERVRRRRVAKRARSFSFLGSHSLSLFTNVTMTELPSLLLASLNPASRKQAEQNLHALSAQPGFLPVLLRLVLETTQDRSVRLAASVFFKNVVKNKWEDVRDLSFHVVSFIHQSMQEESPVPEADKAALRAALVAAMIQLSTPSDKTIRAQIAESISLIASADFPQRWSDLIDVRFIMFP